MALPVIINEKLAETESSYDYSPNVDSNKLFKEKVEDFMHKNISDSELSVDKFSKDLGVSRSLLYIQMKKVYGCTPNTYIQNCRLDKAYDMLINCKELNISEIAYRCGFSDPKYFSRCFKKIRGYTPTEIRDNHK